MSTHSNCTVISVSNAVRDTAYGDLSYCSEFERDSGVSCLKMARLRRNPKHVADM